MKIVLIILLIVCSIFLLIKAINYMKNKRYLLQRFKENNVIVGGRKGRGKDLLFQYVINKRHDTYYSNIYYGKDYRHVNLNDVSVEPNTYEDLIKNNLTKILIPFEEEKDIYISDIGNYLPSQYDYLLHKYFKSLPIYYSLSRHLANHNIHCNAQNLERIWKPLREQGDTFIICKGVKKFPFFLKINMIVYEKYNSALEELLPMKKQMFNKENKALLNQYEATHGKITAMHLFIRKSKIYYDTRAFKQLLVKDSVS